MSGGKLLDTKTVTFNEILGNGKMYRVPLFQRDYSWEQDQWEDLWNDLEALGPDGSHYLGTVVLQSRDKKEFSIIDGQQRLTTLSLLALAVIAEIRHLADQGRYPEQNQERADLLVRQYIGQKHPTSLRYSSKLFLNENNDAFFQSRLLEFKEPINERKLSDSEKLLWQAYRYLRAKVHTKFGAQSGEVLSDFLTQTVGDGLMFIQIVVEDELNAYTVFETLNSRGLELTSTDLLKNFLFSFISASTTDLNQVKVQWKKILDIVGLKEFPVFLRFYLLSTRKLVTKEYLFKEIKQFVKKGEDVFELLEQLESFAYVYVALSSPDDELWKTNKEIPPLIRSLQIFKVTQWKSVAMVAAQKLNFQTDFARFLQGMVALSFRYNVIGRLQTNEMERVYSRVAIRLYRGEVKTLQDVFQELKALYPADEDFKNYFMTKAFQVENSQERKLARYTLYKLESQEKGGSQYDFESDEGTIEHILPESHPENWQENFSEDEHARYLPMLGNLTLLEAGKNRDLGNLDFESKKAVYLTSKFALTRSIQDHDWNAAHIKNRQERLARLATSVWKISF